MYLRLFVDENNNVILKSPTPSGQSWQLVGGEVSVPDTFIKLSCDDYRCYLAQQLESLARETQGPKDAGVPLTLHNDGSRITLHLNEGTLQEQLLKVPAPDDWVNPPAVRAFFDTLHAAAQPTPTPTPAPDKSAARVSRPYIPRVEVVWQDAAQHSGYHNIQDGQKFSLEKMETRGYLVAETDTALLVAQTLSEFQAGDILAIPKSAVLSKEIE